MDNLKFGKVLKNLRINRNFTIRMLSSVLSISPAYICDLEQGNRKITLELLNKIRERLNLTEDEEMIVIEAFTYDRLSIPLDLLNYLIDNNLIGSLKTLKDFDKDGSNIKKLALNLKNKK